MSRTATIFVPFIRAFGGVERLVASVVEHCAGGGLACTVLCFDDGIDFASFVKAPVSVRVLRTHGQPGGGLLALRGAARGALGDGLAWLVFDLKGAFYASALSHPYVLHLTDPPSLLGRDVSKYAFSMHHLLPTTAPRPSAARSIRGELVHRVTRLGVRRARRVVAMTEVIGREIEMRYGVTAMVVRPGITLPVTVPPRRVYSGAYRLLSISRLEASKRIDRILEALAELAMSGRAGVLHCDVVGVGSGEGELRRLADLLGLTQQVTFHGHVSDDRLETLYAEADLVMMPAVQGYGLPALEALARRVPVVLARESGVSEILGDTPWVHLLDEPSSDNLAKAICTMRCVGRPSLREMPHIPTDHEWAAQIAALCEWSLTK